MRKLQSSEVLQGKYVNLREITLEDAQFVLDLRCDQKKSLYLSKTEPNLQNQIDYINSYSLKKNEWYFIIENKAHKPLGTIRLYDVVGDTFTGGSWLMSSQASVQEVIEGEIIFKEYAFNVLGFKYDIFDVNKKNKKVVNYHKMWNTKIVSEDDENYHFQLTREIYENQKKRFLEMIA